MNYASIHNNLDLYDKITYSGASGGATGTAGRIDRFATGMVLTTEGIPIIAEGNRSTSFQGREQRLATAMNSYNASDAVNAIHWSDKTVNANVFAYYKDAITLRKASLALRLTTWGAVHNQVNATADGSVVIGRFGSNPATPTSYDTVVVDNPTGSTYNVALPPGTWTKVLDTTGAVAASDNACGSL